MNFNLLVISVSKKKGVVTAKTILDAIILIVCGASLFAVFLTEHNSYKLGKVQGRMEKKEEELRCIFSLSRPWEPSTKTS